MHICFAFGMNLAILSGFYLLLQISLDLFELGRQIISISFKLGPSYGLIIVFIHEWVQLLNKILNERLHRGLRWRWAVGVPLFAKMPQGNVDQLIELLLINKAIIVLVKLVPQPIQVPTS